jgi:hypothetical protein
MNTEAASPSSKLIAFTGAVELYHELSHDRQGGVFRIVSIARFARVQRSTWNWAFMLAVFIVVGLVSLKYLQPWFGWAVLGVGAFTVPLGWALSRVEHFNKVDPVEQVLVFPGSPTFEVSTSADATITPRAGSRIEISRIKVIEFAIDRYRPSSRRYQVQGHTADGQAVVLFHSHWSPLAALQELNKAWSVQLSQSRLPQRLYPSWRDWDRLVQGGKQDLIGQVVCSVRRETNATGETREIYDFRAPESGV